MDKWLSEFTEYEIAHYEKYEAVNEIHIQQMELIAENMDIGINLLKSHNKGKEDKNPIRTANKCLSRLKQINTLEAQKQIIIAKPIKPYLPPI